MKNNQTIKKNSMMKKLKIHNLSMLVIAASLSACSLSKPGDKERSSMLNGDGDFQSVSIKKKTPGSSTKTGDSGNNAADKEAMASASFSSGESVALGSFVSKVAKECGESPAVHKIAHISGDLALNLNAVRTLLDEKQKDTKESDKVNFEVLTEAIFGEDLGKEIVAGKSEPIVQWVNYCQKTADDPKIYGWITDNTLIAEKIAYAPKMKPVLSEPQALSLAWAKQNLANMLAGINPIAHADDTVDLSSIKVPVYPLIDSSIDNDQVTAYYQKTAAANFLPESLQYSFGLYASAVGEKINANSPEEEKIIFNAEQRIIPTGQKAQLKGTNEVKFSTDSKGASDIYMKVHVLDDNGEPDKQNFFTWIQGHLDGMAGLTAKQRAVLVNTGNGKVIVPSPDDINAMAERAPQTDSEATSEQGENHNNTSTTSSADDSGDTSNPGTSTDSNTTTLQTQPTKETFYSLPSWVHGQGNNTSQVGTPSDQPVLVSKEKATLNSTLNPFEGTDFECPSGYNLVSLKIACADCLGPDMEGFGWSKEQLKANNETLESQENYKMLDDIFGPNTAQTLLASKDGAQHTINICFNDEEYMGYFDDANFKNTATEKIKFFKRNEFNPIVIHNGADGQKHLNVEVSYRAYYTAYPDVVNNLKTVTKSHLIGELDQHTLFYQLNTDKSMYSICANPDLKPQIPVEDKKYARSLKRLQFLIPLDDLGNLHKNIESPVTVKIGARNIPTPSYEEYESLLLAQFSSLPYLIAGDMNVTSVEYVQHNQDVYKTLGAKIIASASPNVVSPHSADDNFDLANFESNMRQGSSEVSTEHPGQYFKQPQAIEEDLLKQEKENNPLYGTTVISNQEMISQCNNYAYRFGVSLNGRYTLLDYFDTTKQKLTDLSESVPKIKEILNDFFLLPIKHIANNTKRTTWNVYICSNTLETGILNDNAYIAFLDTMPNAPDEVSGVFKISKPHSSVVIESNDNKNKLLVGLDIVSFDLHDGDRVGEYMNLPSIVVSGIKKQQATRINFQFTGQFNLDSRDIRKASQTVSSRFHFADTVRRLKFEPSLDPINNTFEVVTEVRNTNPAVVIYDPITFHKNSLTLPEEKRSRNFPADIDPAQPFDGYLQTFGELNAFKFGFWLEG